MVQLTEEFANALLPDIYQFFELGRQEVPDVRSEIFNIERSTLDSERMQGLGAIDYTPMSQYQEQGRIGQAESSPGFEVTIKHQTWSMELPVDRALIEDSQYSIINNHAMRLGRAYAVKVQKDAADLFNNAENLVTRPYPSPDGKALLADDHPLGPNNPTTWDNLGGSGVTAANIKAGRAAMMRFKNDVGHIAPAIPNILLVGPDAEDDALEITKSQYSIDSNKNNAINPQYGRYRLIVWPFLETGQHGWFLIDSTLAQSTLKWYSRRPLEITINRPNTERIVFQLSARYSYGYSDARFVYGKVSQ